jgi:nifR3 family TIM-barrel protein
MKKNFWQKLAEKKKPFFVLAPMADVTDIAERQMLVKHGKPDVLYTEFVSCDGIMSKGREVLLKDLRFLENEHPIVAQFFGAKPENFFHCAQLARELGFDGFDINMGCPDRSVEKQGAGAALMKNPKLAREIICRAKEGAGEMPVSVKTRIGYNKNEIETWLPELLAEKPAAIIIHGRTRKEMSLTNAHWDVIARAVEIAKGSGVIIIGNGDVESLEDGRQKAEESGVDGIMVGRGIFGNPWFFNEPARNATHSVAGGEKNIENISIQEKLRTMIEHAKIFEKELTGIKGYHILKKHYKAYANGFDGAKELRAKLMETNSATEAEEIVNEFLQNSGIM